MALPQVVTPLGRIDLTRLDYFGIVEQIRNIIETDPRYQNKFTSLFEGDAAVMLIELFAQIAHLNNLRLDFIANEQSWVNAEQPQTILNFLPLIDFKLRSVTASTTTVYAQVVNQPGNLSPVQLLIPARTKINATNLEGSSSVAEILASPSNYTSDVLLQPNVRTYTLNVFAGETDFTEVRVNKPENFTFKIDQENVVNGSIQIFLQEGDNDYTLLDKVDSFLIPLNSLPQYTVRYDFQGRPTIIFGNRFFGGKFDGIVQNDESSYKNLRIYFRYLTDTGGSVTNYAPGAIDQRISFYSPILDDDITLQFFNQLAGTGGSDIMTLDQVRQIAPLTLRTADKAVTNEDYEIFLSQDPLVKDVLAITPSDEPALNIPIFYAHLYVAPNRLNASFIPTNTPVQDYELPDVVPGETESNYVGRFERALTNFYNIRGMETSARVESSITGINSSTTFPVVQNVNDRMRIVLDTDDIISGYVDIKFQENFNKPVSDVINEINSNFTQNIASVENGKIVMRSPIIGDGSYIQLLGNNTNSIDDDVLNETYITFGFTRNQSNQGLPQTQEASNLNALIQDKKVIGIETRFRPIRANPFTISVNVYHNRNSDPFVVEQAVRDALYDQFSYQSSFISNSIRPSKVGNIIQNVDGVEFVELQNFQTLEASLNQIYFLLDPIIIQNLPSEFPDMAERYELDITMIRAAQ